jgi:hypothetical protein
MGSVRMNRARALLICHSPQAYAPSRVREAGAYLLGMSGATELEQRLAADAIEWLRGRQDAPRKSASMPAAVKQKRKAR